MNCRIIQRSISEFLDNELTGEQVLDFKSHLRECEACRAELEAMRRVRTSLAHLPQVAPNPEFEARLFASVLSDSTPVVARRRTLQISLGFLASATVMGSVLYALFGGASSGATLSSPKARAVAETVSVRDFASDQSAFSGSDPFGGFAAPINVQNDEP